MGAIAGLQRCVVLPSHTLHRPASADLFFSDDTPCDSAAPQFAHTRWCSRIARSVRAVKSPSSISGSCEYLSAIVNYIPPRDSNFFPGSPQSTAHTWRALGGTGGTPAHTTHKKYVRLVSKWRRTFGQLWRPYELEVRYAVLFASLRVRVGR
jgi:hypothetical protein